MLGTAGKEFLKLKGRQIMKEIITVTPDKLARSHGGDRYKGLLFGREWAVYIPQTITRPDGKPVKSIKITIETVEEV